MFDFIFVKIGSDVTIGGGVEDTKLKATKKYTRPTPRTALPIPRTGMPEAKDQGHNATVTFPKNLGVLLKERIKMVFSQKIRKFSVKFEHSPG